MNKRGILSILFYTFICYGWATAFCWVAGVDSLSSLPVNPEEGASRFDFAGLTVVFTPAIFLVTEGVGLRNHFLDVFLRKDER